MIRSNQRIAPPQGDREYRIVEPLGEGGFGEVYIATDESGDEVALKVMDEHQQRSWITEVHFGFEIFGRLDDPKVVSLRDAFPWVVVRGGRPALRWVLVFDLAAGGSLVDYVENNDPWPLKRLRQEMADVMSALEVLHQAVGVHRDLTPLNILVDGDGHLKVADFGIARHRHSRGQEVHMDAFNPGFVPWPMEAQFGWGRWGEIDDLWQAGQILAMLATWDTSRCYDLDEIRSLDIDDHLKTVIARSIGSHTFAFDNATDMKRALLASSKLRFKKIRTLRGRSICFTGPMGMVRADAEKRAKKAGATVHSAPSWQTDTIVVGSRSPLWAGGSQGQKLFLVEKLIGQNHQIDLVDEATFLRLVR